MLSTRSLSDGRTYRSSSLPSLHLQAKGSEYSFATRRRVPERNSPKERRNVGVRNSSSGPCVLDPTIEQNCSLFTGHFFAAAKVIHSWLRGGERSRSSPPVNNFGRTISATASRRFDSFGDGLRSHRGSESAAGRRTPSAARPFRRDARHFLLSNRGGKRNSNCAE